MVSEAHDKEMNVLLDYVCNMIGYKVGKSFIGLGIIIKAHLMVFIKMKSEKSIHKVRQLMI
jgi:hypothetical protein